MVSLLLRNLFFTILQPGIVAGVIPFMIAEDLIKNTLAKPFIFHHFLGITVFIIGFAIMMICIVSFAENGRGTLSPADPTKRLVVTGFYKFSRNPMYVGVTMILIGEVIFFQSIYLGFYLMFVFIGFNIFILFYEEPRLRKDFGEAYNLYCKQVRRWI